MMDQELVEKMWALQMEMKKDSVYQSLCTKSEAMNMKFLSALENMTQAQESAVLDYLGYLLEIHFKTIEYLIR